MNYKNNSFFAVSFVSALAVLLVGCETYVGVRRIAPVMGDVDSECVRQSLERVAAVTHVEHRVRVTSPHPPETADGHTDLFLYTTHRHAVYLTITRAYGDDVRYSSESIFGRRTAVGQDLWHLRDVMAKAEQAISEECGVNFEVPVTEECIGFRCPE